MADASDTPTDPGDDLLDDDEDDERPQSFGDRMREFARAWGPPILAVLLIRTFIFEPFRIPSGSMVPTLQIGDHVFVTKSSYGLMVPATGVEIPFLDNLWVVPRFQLLDFGGPSRGDIIVFRYPRAPWVNYIKRVVAIPGDTIRVRNNRIEINGERQKWKRIGDYKFINDVCKPTDTNFFRESLTGLDHDVLTRRIGGSPLANHPKTVVPPGKVFVMGDNRDNSEDSRAWGFVDYNQIKGRAHFVWFSWNGCSGGLGSPRGERVGFDLYQ